MNRIRFSRLSGTPAENPPATPEARPTPEQRPLAGEQLAPAPNVALVSREDRDLIEQVQTRLLSESTNSNAKRDPDHYSRRIAQLVTEHLER